MVRRIGVIFLSMSLILGAVAAHCPARQIIQDSSLSDEGWRELSYIPLPQEYKDYKWRAGFDFAHLRDVVIPDMKTGQTIMFVGLAISMSMLCAAAVKWLAAKLLGEAAVVAGQQATHWDKLRGGAEAATGSGAGTGAAFGVEKGLGKIGINLEWPQTVTDQVRFLETELGISDYYVFGAAKAWVSEVTLPLGTRMQLRIGSSYDYYNMGYPPGEFRIIYDSWPRVLRWKTPDLDFEKLDARVWERDITGKLQPTTVRRVFPYEVVDGKIFPFTREGKPSGLSVRPDTPKKGGKIVGKVSLKYLPQLGESGLREVHVCSPVNQGVWAKKLDDYAFAIVINRRTVSATPSKKELNVGEKLVISVEVAGFHPAKATIRASDGKVYPREDWAGAILRGASLQGAGITETKVEHERERTLLKGTPREGGKVNLVLQTRDGPLIWEEVATVEDDLFSGSWQGTIRGRRIKGRHPPEFFEKGGREITHRPPVGVWESPRPFKFRVTKEDEQAIRVFFGSAERGYVFNLYDNVARHARRDEDFTPAPRGISIVYRHWDWTLTFKKNEVYGKVYCTTMFDDRLWEKEEFEIQAKRVEQMD